MPVNRCPKCEVPLTRSEEDSGICPACANRLPAPGARHLDHDVDASSSYGEYSRREWSGGASSSWSIVRMGLSTMLVSYLVFLGLYLLTIAAAVIAMNLAPPSPQSAEMFLLGVACLLLILGIAYLVGMVLCLKAPEGKGAIVGAVTCVGSIFFLFCIMVAVSLASNRANPGIQALRTAPIIILILAAVVGLLSLACGACIIMFLRAVANAFSRRTLGRTCSWFLVAYFVSWLLAVGRIPLALIDQQPMGVGRMNINGTGDVMLAVLTVLSAGLGIALLIWKAVLLWMVRNAISTR